MQVFNVQNKSIDGTLVKQDLLTEQQVLTQLQENSKMENDDIDLAIARMKSTSETLFIEGSCGNKIYFNATSVLIH
jgi:hypothetical protein